MAKSSAKVQYQSLVFLAVVFSWVTYLLKDIDISLSHPPWFFIDNISTLHLMENLILNARTKHIKHHYHYMHEKVIHGALERKFIPSEIQIENILTKTFPNNISSIFYAPSLVLSKIPTLA